MKIALTNLGKYNEGELVYTWLSLPFTHEELEAAFEEIKVKPNTEYEEYFISDYETDISGLKIEPYTNIYKLNELIEKVAHFGSYELETLAAILEAYGDDLKEAIRIFEDGDYSYYSDVQSYTELAELLVEDGLFGPIATHLEHYIDYEKIGRDLKFDYFKTSNGFINLF